MIRRMYTKSLDPKYHDGRALTKEIQVESRKKTWRNFSSGEEYYEYYKFKEPEKVERTEDLIYFCKKNNIKNVLSIGAGESLTEITLKYALPDIQIMCTDYDLFICSKLEELFKEIEFKEFNMKKPDFSVFKAQYDLILFLGSSYVMNNQEYISLFKSFHRLNPKFVYIMIYSYIPIKDKINEIKGHLAQTFKIVTGYTTSKDLDPPGVFHGYARDSHELKEIYRCSGWRAVQLKYLGGIMPLWLCKFCTTKIKVILKKKTRD